jgi:DNA-binding NarL/FixJ family response regulator
VRIVVAEDSVLFREGLVRLLKDAGHAVVDVVDDADALHSAVAGTEPDLVLVDVRLPPTLTDDGARAAARLREQNPRLPIVLLSQHVETRHLLPLIATGAFGYLLKDRVLAVDDFLETLERVRAGGTALDPTIVAALVTPIRTNDPLRNLTPRERDVLAAAAEGRSNASIAAQLVITERTAEAHMRAIFRKLAIDDSPDSHRRVLAVVAHLTQQSPSHPGHP